MNIRRLWAHFIFITCISILICISIKFTRAYPGNDSTYVDHLTLHQLGDLIARKMYLDSYVSQQVSGNNVYDIHPSHFIKLLKSFSCGYSKCVNDGT